jgi:hypothetical protein
VNVKRSLMAAVFVILALCLPAAAIDLGVSVGRDVMTVTPDQQPFLASAHCGLWRGRHFVLRLSAGYAALLSSASNRTPSGYAVYERTGLDAVMVQVAPCASADLPGIPVYVQAGFGCGARLGWKLVDDNGDDLEKTYTRGLDASGLAAVGIRFNRRLSLELGMERLLADWSFTRVRLDRFREGLGYVEQGRTETTSLNWQGNAEPGYTAGIVLTL